MHQVEKPDWLKSLEDQSWQAELIASGLAIVGSVSLGGYLEALAESIIPLFNDRVLGMLENVFMYLFIAQLLLVMCFVGHLVLRIIWAAFLGLSSVYPNGINAEAESNYTPDFLKKLKEDFPSISSYTLVLDNYCSIIFSILCCIVLMLLGMAFWFCIFIALSELLSLIFSPEIATGIRYAFLVLFFLTVILLSLMSIGSFKERDFSKKYAYLWNESFSKFLYFIGYKTYSYLFWTITTNVKTKRLGLMGFLFGILAAHMMFIIRDPIISNFSSKSYARQNNIASLANRNNYEDQLDCYKILRPIIQSREIEDDYIKLFIPQMHRDAIHKAPLCGEYSKDKNLTRREQRQQRENFDVVCAQQYYQVFIDEEKYSQPDFQFIRHEHNNEKGYLAYLRIDSIPSGKHLLKIETAYKNQDNENTIRILPFYKVN